MAGIVMALPSMVLLQQLWLCLGVVSCDVFGRKKISGNRKQ